MIIVRVLLMSMVLIGVYAFSGDQGQLTREEVLEGENIGLKQGQLIERRAGIIKDIQPQLNQIEALNKAIDNYATQLGVAETKIMEARKLDTSKFMVNWKESKIEEKPKEQASK